MKGVVFGLLAVGASLVYAMATGTGTSAHPHPFVSGMVSGGGEAPSFTLGYGVAIIGLFGAFVSLGVRPAARRKRILSLAVGTLVVMGAWVTAWILPADAVLDGIPLRTLWIWFVFAFAPLFFVYLFCRHFRELIHDDEERSSGPVTTSGSEEAAGS